MLPYAARKVPSTWFSVQTGKTLQHSSDNPSQSKMQKGRRKKKAKQALIRLLAKVKQTKLENWVDRQQLASLLLFPMSGCQWLNSSWVNIQKLGWQAYLASQINKARRNKLYYYLIQSPVLGLVQAELLTSTSQLAVYPKGLFPPLLPSSNTHHSGLVRLKIQKRAFTLARVQLAIYGNDLHQTFFPCINDRQGFSLKPVTPLPHLPT